MNKFSLDLIFERIEVKLLTQNAKIGHKFSYETFLIIRITI